MKRFAASIPRLKELLSRKRYSKVATICDRLIRSGIDEAEAYAFRGAALEKMGWPHEALANYNQAVEMDKTYSFAVQARGLLKLRMGEEESARADLATYCRLHPEEMWPGTVRELDKLAEQARREPVSSVDIYSVSARSFARADLWGRCFYWSLVISSLLLLWRRNGLPSGPWGFTAFFVFSILFLMIVGWRWLRSASISQKKIRELVNPMVRFVFASKNQHWLRKALTSNLVLAMMLVLGGFSFPVLFYLASLTLSLGVVLNQILPPTILFLASSDASSVANWFRLTKASYGHRAMALLSISELNVQWPIKQDLAEDNLRTTDRCLWRLVVHPLMEIAPVIVVDGNSDTPFVIEEVERLVRIGAIQKTIVVTENETCPLLDRLAKQLGDQRITTIDSKDTARQIRKVIQQMSSPR